MSDGVECMFTCKVCGATKQPFTVRYRETHEGVVEWVNGAVRPAMHKAHIAFAAACPSPHCDLMLPIDDGAKGLGMRTLN